MKKKAVRFGLALLVLYLALTGNCGGFVTTQDPGTGTTSFAGIAWQSAGDSYSSGEGVEGNEGACAQSKSAYGPTAQRLLGQRSGTDKAWTFSSVTFTACTGRMVEEYFNVVPGSEAESDKKSSMWQWGIDQKGGQRLDVLTMSFGGNDIGFGEIIRQCLIGVPESNSGWKGFLSWTPTFAIVNNFTGCDESRDELESRVRWLVDPGKTECDGWRSVGTAELSCPLRLQSRQGSLVDFYVDLVRNQLTDRGHLYIVSYPRVVAPSSEWKPWQISCHGILRGDADKLGDVAATFNSVLNDAVQRANAQLGAERVHLVDRLALFRNGSHELCGTGDEWINGLSRRRGSGLTFRIEGSFHPNAGGHAATATELVRVIDATFG